MYSCTPIITDARTSARTPGPKLTSGSSRGERTVLLRILVITAHPHYAGTNCAGTLFNHVSRGDEVYVISLTAGDLMTDRVTRAELAKINQADMEASADILGFKETRILGFQDGEVRKRARGQDRAESRHPRAEAGHGLHPLVPEQHDSRLQVHGRGRRRRDVLRTTRLGTVDRGAAVALDEPRLRFRRASAHVRLRAQRLRRHHGRCRDEDEVHRLFRDSLRVELRR